jgi:hypothetical protein
MARTHVLISICVETNHNFLVMCVENESMYSNNIGIPANWLIATPQGAM